MNIGTKALDEPEENTNKKYHLNVNLKTNEYSRGTCQLEEQMHSIKHFEVAIYIHPFANRQ